MAPAHSHLSEHSEDSWLHRAPAAHKVLATLVLVLAVVAVPARTWWPFAIAFGVLVAAALSARLHPPAVLRRMLVEVPVIVFALALPFFASGPRVEVIGLPVSETGMYAAVGMLAKATVGVLAGVILASTTEPPAMIEGLQRLRMPALLVQIASFMLRYLTVVTDDLKRMRIARESRGSGGGALGHARATARSAGALFVRSYERGERVHLAMLSRGYAGAMPVLADVRPARVAPALLAGVGLVACATIVAWLLR